MGEEWVERARESWRVRGEEEREREGEMLTSSRWAFVFHRMSLVRGVTLQKEDLTFLKVHYYFFRSLDQILLRFFLM